MRRYLSILFCLFGSQVIFGQFSCLFDHYSTRDGLSHGYIRNILKDSKGFMWFGTFDGINKFDGFAFTSYKARPGDTASLSSNRVDILKEDKLGFLWLKTYDSKIYRFDRRTENFDNVLEDIGAPKETKIETFFQTSVGDMWLLTDNSGIYRIETDPVEYSFTPTLYSSSGAGENKIYDNTMFFYHEDRMKQIWLGTAKGLNCLQYDNKTGKYRSTPLHLMSALKNHDYHFTCLAENKGLVWFGSEEGELAGCNLMTGEWRLAGLENSSPITTIQGKNNDVIYIATDGNGIFRFNTKNARVENHSNNPSVERIKRIYIDSHNLLWLEGNSEGVIKTDPWFKSMRHYSQKTDANPSLQIGSNSSFYEDKNDILWIALKEGGFGYYNRETDNFDYFFNKPGDPESKMSNSVNCFYVDTTGVLWLSTYFRGIEKVTLLRSNFHFMMLSQKSLNKTANEVRSVFEDRNGLLWIGTKDGTLHILDRQNNIIREYSQEIAFGMVYSIFQGKDGTIWLGTKGHGLFSAKHSYKDGTGFVFTQYRNNPHNENSLSSDMVYSVIEDAKERIWVGTFGGGLNLLERKDGKIQIKNTANSFKNYPRDIASRIRHLKEDKRGNIWIATTEGLFRFNPDKSTHDDCRFFHYRKIPGDSSSLGSNDVFYIFSDMNDSLWLGTLGGGLNKMTTYPGESQEPEFKVYTVDDGLPADAILSIEEDNKDNLWLSTENGISVFNIHKQQFKNYDESDGIKYSAFSEATSCRRASGEIYFGSLYGLYFFNPEDFPEKSIQPNLVLTNFRLFNQDVRPGAKNSPLSYAISETNEIVLKYHQNMFSIEYAGLDYRAQNKIQYKYTLEGFDNEVNGWHFVKNQHMATYTNVLPGKYIFRVRYANPDMIRQSREVKLNITVLPPPWKTGWAYTAYIILLIVIVEVTRRIAVTMIRLRNKVVIEKEMTDLKLRFFTNISHELRTPLTLITGPVDEISRNENLSSKGKEYIQLIERNANRMLKLINQLLDFRKIQNKRLILKLSYVDICTFVNEICSNFKELASEKKIDFRINSNIGHLKLWFDEEKIDIVIFNLLSNAFKFTPSGKHVELNIQHKDEDDYVSIEVVDQGIGIPKDKAPLIFKRFSDIHASKGIKSVGTGIGLSLSKELIDLHNGKISFESTEGSGTKFRIELRLGDKHFNKEWVEFVEDSKLTLKISNPELRNSSALDYYPDQEDGNEKIDVPEILIIEDNIELRKFIADQFKDSFKIKEADDGLEGYEKAVHLLPDIIISDIMMPGMDGIELIKRLKNDFNTSHIPVILLTAKSSVESKLEGLKYGADAYLTKPFNTLHLKAQIYNLLNQRKLLIEKFTNKVRLPDVHSEDEVVVTDRDNEFLKTVVAIIEENISNSEFKIDQISRSIGLGRTSFFKKLKGLTGMPPIDFVNEYRLKSAFHLLQTGNYNISEVSYMTGFNDPGYFSKRFKERFKKAPSSYLKLSN